MASLFIDGALVRGSRGTASPGVDRAEAAAAPAASGWFGGAA